MRLLILLSTVFLLIQLCCCSISGIYPGYTGLSVRLSTTQGLVLSIFLLTILIFGDFGIIPIKGKDLIGGRHARSVMNRFSYALDKDTLLKVARELDIIDCGLRYLCEIAGQPESNLVEEEKLLVKMTNLGDEDPFTKMRRDPADSIFPFTFAGYVGRTSEGSECGKTFRNCPYNLKEIRTFVAPKNFFI